MDRAAELRRISRNALRGAGVLAVLIAVSGYLAFHVRWVERIDASVFNGFSGLDHRPHVDGLAGLIAGVCDPFPYVLLAMIPVGIALRRGRALLAVVILGLMFCANMTTEILKPLTAGPRPAGLPPGVVDQASWPSGHATASMTLALCTVLACPPRWRPRAAALGAAFAVAVSYSFLTLGWHYPSDAFAGFLMAAMWTLLAVAAITGIEARLPGVLGIRPAEIVASRALAPPGVAVAAFAAVCGGVLLLRPTPVLDYASAHAAFVAAAAALGALGLAVATGVMMTLGRWPQRKRPGSQSGSSPAFAPRLRMNSRSESRLR